MHELSIAENIVRIVTREALQSNAQSVTAVSLKIGDLSGVVKDALMFSFDIATKGTVMEGAVLDIEEVPVAIYCSSCNEVNTLVEKFRFRCPLCQELSGDIRQGKELEVTSIEIE